MTIASLIDKVYKKRAELSVAEEDQEQLVRLYENAMEMHTHIEKAQELVQAVAKTTQERIKFELEEIVQHALDAVFEGQYEFQIIFEIKRGKTEANIMLTQDGNEIDLDDGGGGVRDVLSFALRVALLVISKGRKILILDEIGHFISAGIKPQFYTILGELSRKLGIQVIGVTHDELMMQIADKSIKVTKVKGVSHVKDS